MRTREQAILFQKIPFVGSECAFFYIYLKTLIDCRVHARDLRLSAVNVNSKIDYCRKRPSMTAPHPVWDASVHSLAITGCSQHWALGPEPRFLPNDHTVVQTCLHTSERR